VPKGTDLFARLKINLSPLMHANHPVLHPLILSFPAMAPCIAPATASMQVSRREKQRPVHYAVTDIHILRVMMVLITSFNQNVASNPDRVKGTAVTCHTQILLFTDGPFHVSSPRGQESRIP
jgi:hypothetical protein